MGEGVKDAAEMNVFARLIMDRIIFLGSEIDDEVANVVCAQMLYLASLDAEAPIKLYINSPGGSCYAGLAIYDTMQMVSCPVHTFAIGLAASMAFVLTCAGEPGFRYSLPHTRQHQPSTWSGRQDTTDQRISLKESESIGEDLYGIIAHHTGQKLSRVRKDCDRDHWMKPEEAQKYGVIDHIFAPKKAHARG